MPEIYAPSPKPFTPEQVRDAHDKIRQAVEDDMPTAYVKRGDGHIEGDWLPYDTQLYEGSHDIDKGNLWVSLAKPKEGEDGYNTVHMHFNDFAATQQEVREIETEVQMHADKETQDRVRAVRMSAAYRRYQEIADRAFNNPPENEK